MIKINRRSSFLRPLLVTALPLVLLEAGTMTAYSACVSVTGANGGGAATATATTTTDPSSCATATGGNGASGFGFAGSGNGGAATSTATTSINAGDASAEAASFGGHGGAASSEYLDDGHVKGRGGNGGAASSSATASSGTGSASVTASSTASSNGGVGTVFGYPPGGGAGGTASSSAAASSTTGSVSATASSAGGANGVAYNGGALNRATVSANARNSAGAALTSASAPDGSALTNAAVTNATVGPGSAAPVAITAGQAVSNATLTIGNGSILGIGAMSAAYGGAGEALEYSATAVLDFTTTKSQSLELYLQDDNFSGIGFGTLDLSVTVGEGPPQTYSLSSLTGAESFFQAHALDLGSLGIGPQSIQLDYSLYYAGTYGYSGDAGGFGFTYDIATTSFNAPLTAAASDFAAGPLTAIPEPSTWAMMALGFAALAFAGYRGSRKGAAFAA